MTNYYLAIDIGATSGRHILGHLENNQFVIEEIFRFKNRVINENNHLFWDIDYLFENILEGLKKCKELNKIPSSIGIDTFGVDYALLDNNNQLIKKISSYRDSRTIRTKEKFHDKISIEELYSKTGVYPQNFNTVYQLYDDYLNGYLKNVNTIMFLPCYLGYLLTGKKCTELSIASTSGLLDRENLGFNNKVLRMMNLESNIFPKIVNCGDVISTLTPEIQQIVGFNSELKCVFSHDTASACYGADVENGELFLSSGTWSLIGFMNHKMIADEKTLERGFTNELNDKNHVRFLKNIIGMFIINEVVKEQKLNKPITQIVEEAKVGAHYEHVFDPTDNRFLSASSMIGEIKSYFIERGIKAPSTNSELYYCVYHSLAYCYKQALDEIEELTKVKINCIKIFGGGSNNLFLNKLTEDIAKVKVIKKDSEATAIGNLKCQIKN